MLTNDEKAALAKLCGMVEHKHKMYPSWIIHPEDPKKRQHIYNFDPEHDGQHTMLVLEGLRKDERVRDWEIGNCRCGCGGVAIRLMFDNDENETLEVDSQDSVGDAVCTAGLEVIGKDGG